MEIKGRFLKRLSPEIKGRFTSYKFWMMVDENSNYPQVLAIDYVEKLDLEISKLGEGESIEAKINLRGRKWTNKDGVEIVFNSINCWFIKILKEDDERINHNVVVEDVEILPEDTSDVLPF